MRCTSQRLVDHSQESTSMIRRTIAATFHPDDGDVSMRVVEVFLALLALVAAGILAFLR
jgi:hypothetical protein